MPAPLLPAEIPAPPTTAEFHYALLDLVDRMQPAIAGQAPIESIATRACGGCMVCCVAPSIGPKQIEEDERAWFRPKAAGAACMHCRAAGGCAIYDKRPSICRGYLCLWVMGIPVTYPGASGIAWTFQPDGMFEGMTLAMGHCLDASAALDDVDVRRDIHLLLSAHLPMRLSAVVLRSANHIVRFDAAGEFPHLVADIDPADPMRDSPRESTQRRAHLPRIPVR